MGPGLDVDGDNPTTSSASEKIKDRYGRGAIYVEKHSGGIKDTKDE
jgi:hypothetical protein